MVSQRGIASRIVCASLAAALVAAPAAAQKVIYDYDNNSNPAAGDLLLLQPNGSRTNPYNNLKLQQLWTNGLRGMYCAVGAGQPLLNQANQPMLNQAGQQMLTSGTGAGACLATSCAGQISGSFWNDAGHVAICP